MGVIFEQFLTWKLNGFGISYFQLADYPSIGTAPHNTLGAGRVPTYEILTIKVSTKKILLVGVSTGL